MQYRIETQRLGLRELRQEDFSALCLFLQDIEVMYAWEYAFSDEQVRGFISNQQKRYRVDGFGYYAAVEKASGKVIGCMGPLMEQIGGEKFYGIGYILGKEAWGKGYATEAGEACIRYLFENYPAEKVIAEIRPENRASVRVAERLGMKKESQFIKVVNGKQMPHAIYARYAEQ